MQNNSSFPPISPPLHGIFLAVFSTITALLLGTGFSLYIAGNSLVHNWQERMEQNSLIALPPATTTPATQPDQRLNTLLQHLTLIPQITRLHVLNPHDIQILLSTWSAPWPEPLPVAITFHYTGDVTQLRQMLHNLQPDALLIPPPPQAQLLPPLSHALQTASMIIAILLSVIALLIFIMGLSLVLKSTLAREEKNLTLLYHLGGTKSLLYNRIAFMAGMHSFIGACTGICLTLPMINILALTLRPFQHLSLWTGPLWTGIFETSLSLPELVLLWLIPLLLTAGASGLARISLSLRQHPMP